MSEIKRIEPLLLIFFRAFGVRQIHAGTESSGAAGDDALSVMYHKATPRD